MGTVFNLPNQITIARLILSVVFFVMLGLFDHRYSKVGESLAPFSSEGVLLLDFSIAVFVLAAASDFLDGYLARKWGMISTFGRIADPFVDKVFICGSFVFLIPITPLVAPWFVVVIIMREFLVSGLRSFLEARGVAFGAGLGGKLKMTCQSITVPAVLCYRAHFQGAEATTASAAKSVVLVFLAGTLLFTLTSTISYVRKAVLLLQER